MVLRGKNAVVYGAAGGIGSVVCRAFARAGARVHLAGRTLGPVSALAGEIQAAGGEAEAACVDALDAGSVERHAEAIVDRFGSIDVSFNLIGVSHRHGRPLVDLPLAEFAGPIGEYATSHFLTATAAARRMQARGSGVILMLSTEPAHMPIPFVGPFGAALGMIEAFALTLAAEVGPRGVRVICLLSTGAPDTPGVQGALQRHAEATGTPVARFLAEYEEKSVLKRLSLARDVADVATFLASDAAGAITATKVNLSCGLIPA